MQQETTEDGVVRVKVFDLRFRTAGAVARWSVYRTEGAEERYLAIKENRIEVPVANLREAIRVIMRDHADSCGECLRKAKRANKRFAFEAPQVVVRRLRAEVHLLPAA